VKDEFFAWYPRTTQELADIWARAFFVPDANVLLHCFRHASEVREELLRVLELLSDSLWIPYQVGLEFHRNRLEVEVGAMDAYDRLAKDYDVIFNQAREKLRQLRSHPSIDVESELSALEMFFGDFKRRLDSAKESHPADALTLTLNRLTAIFKGRIGPKQTPEEMNATKKEGEDRYARKVPPGYKDAKKDGGDMDKYGDLTIWKAMIEKAKTAKRPIIFISDDAKEDWWNFHRGRKLGARTELLEEFKALSGEDFHVYELAQFLRIAAKSNAEIGNVGTAQIEKSVIEDNEARRKGSSLVQIKKLEAERESLISILAGVPTIADVPNASSHDKETTRSRLAAVEGELTLLRSQESSIDADSKT
jgi:hypothetical protein